MQTIKQWIVATLVALCTVTQMHAQETTKTLTLDDLIPGGRSYSRFAPRTIKQLQWCGDKYFYVKGDSVWQGKPGSKKKEQVLFTRKELNQAMLAAGLKEVGQLPYFAAPYRDQTVLSFTAKKHRIYYNFRTNKVEDVYQVNGRWANLDYTPASGMIAYTDGNNLAILNKGNTITKVTAEKDPDIVCGTSVHRDEFGIHKGTFWSPSGKQLAFYRMDQTMVTDYPLVNVAARSAELNAIKYPMAGMKSHEVTVGIYNTETEQTVYLDTDEPKDRYFTNIQWSPDGQHLYVAEVNRAQNESKLVRYRTATGKEDRLVFTETHPKYVEPQQPVLFLKNNPEQFIWQSQRDGFNHLYLYTAEGALIKQLTQGDWVVTDVLGFDSAGQNLFYVSTEVSPLERHLYKLNLQTGKRIQLTTEAGVHHTQVSASGTYFIDSYSSQNNPRTIAIAPTRKGKATELLAVNNPFTKHDVPTIKLGTIKAADGVTDLHYRLVTPSHLDPNKKYPAIVYVYGGPHAQLITNSWRAGTGGWDVYMAERGYIMFTLDSRGSANRGLEFENVIHRNLGVAEMADQLKGTDFLKSLGYVDANRIGVHGWSYGGFMTTNLMLSHPEVFKVGAAGGPVIDWSYYEVMYGERYMDTPQENPAGYKAANMKNKAGNLKGHLLLIHGDIDPVVLMQHTFSFLGACVDARTYPDYYIYPRHEHNVIGKDRVHLYEKITRYFDDYLK